MIKKILCGLLCSYSFAYGQITSTTEVFSLNHNWEFSQSDTGKWLSATVPGTVHQDLIHHGLLPDPFYGINEEKIQWVENEDWEYKTTFQVTKEQLSRDAAQLTFEGLDTYADVYLNGSLLLRSDNMFVGYSVPVKPVLREGENRLHIYFRSPIKQTLPQWSSNGFDYPADNDHYEKHLSVFTRKAPYSYGWDWGIRMVTCGIWRPIKLCFYDVALINDFHVNQLFLSDNEAKLSNELEINNTLKVNKQVEVHITCSLKEVEKTHVLQKLILHPGTNKIHIPLTIDTPIRWMPNGWGEPTLYSIACQIFCDNKIVSEKKHKIGLRTICVINEKDKKGQSFYFKVNDIPMFVKGTNYIPQDAMLPSVTAERYQNLFRDMKDAHMNMVRVWGGGIYEEDLFYDLADENGILVWQDFIFACTSYPSDPSFLKKVEAEADYNIRRLRNHPSLAMWCGNNEILEGLKYWGWNKKFSESVYKSMFAGYDRLFCELLPNKVKELDAERFYIHGSPYFANWGRPESWATGDSHNWGVWYGEKPFESLDTDIPRFMSEFGFQSFPEMKTIASFASPADYAIESKVMNAHQKSSIGNAVIRRYMERDYIIPEKFEDFVYVGLVLQGHGMRYGMEAHRRNRPYCMGTMYWQLNDSWPVVSWSGIDYFGNWKALHYQAQRAYAPILINPMQEKDFFKVYLISDKLESLSQLSMEMYLIDFNGKQLHKKEITGINLLSNTSLCVFQKEIGSIVNQKQQKNTYMKLLLKDKSGKTLSENVFFFNRTKDLNLPETRISFKVKQREGCCEVVLSSSKLAKDVFIEVPFQGARFSDNFFDLLPRESKKVVITSPYIRKKENINIKIRHIRQTYN